MKKLLAAVALGVFAIAGAAVSRAQENPLGRCRSYARQQRHRGQRGELRGPHHAGDGGKSGRTGGHVEKRQARLSKRLRGRFILVPLQHRDNLGKYFHRGSFAGGN